jgi:sporulation protein YlmC with PRC-barrel domain
MNQERGSPPALIESDRIEGTPVYFGEGKEIGRIKRLIIDKASGKVVYIVITFAQSLGLDNVPYVIPWGRLSYDRRDGSYHTDISEADLRAAPAAAHADIDWGSSESLEALDAFFRIPHGWRSV